MILLRSAAFNLAFYLITAAMAPVGLVLWGLAPRLLLPWIRVWARLMRGLAARLCGIRVEVSGLGHIPAAGPVLIASEHQSAFDTFIWLTLLPDLVYVVKRELRSIPVFGALLRPAGMILVDRAGGATAMRQLLRETAEAAALGRRIVIFPQGTRVAPGTLSVLHPGVAAMATLGKLPVVPVATDSGRCWGRRDFRKRPGVIHIAIGAALPASLRREALLQRLGESWRDLAAEFPVDNSVGE